MGNEKVSRLILTFDGEEGTIDSVLSSIKGRVRSAVADMEATTKRVVLFSDLEGKVKASAEALFDASAKAKILAADLDKVADSGGKATPELIAGLKAANAELKTAESAYNRNVDAITKQHNALTRLGVDTSNAARAQLKLAEATRLAAAAAEEQAAKQLLGVKTLADIQPQIQKINTAYNTLRESGKLSATEIAAAQQQAAIKTRELAGQVTVATTGFDRLKASAASALTSTFGRFLTVTGAATGLAAGIHKVVEAAHEYENGLAKVGTVTSLSREQLAGLGEDARALARDLGLDLPQVLQGLFDLIRSGVPPDNAIEVLRISAQAAKASFVDLSVGVKASNLLIDSFGVDVKDLGGAFDILIKSASLGGPTLTEFANGGGRLLNVARSSKIPLNELVAVLTVMVDKSGDAEGSIDALTKIIIKLGSSDVREKLHALGIDSTDLLDIFRQLGERGIPLQQFIDLGVASTRTAAGVASLTNNTSELLPVLEKISGAAGTTGKALATALDTPAQRSAKLSAAVHDLSVTIGEAVGSGSRFAVVLTTILNAFNSLSPAVKRAVGENAALTAFFGGTPFGGFISALGLTNQALALYASRQKAAAEASRASAQAAGEAGKADLKAVDDGIAKARGDLEAISARLLQQQAALQATSTRELADLQARADAEIAALDRSTAAQETTAATTIVIQKQLAADRLALIRKTEAEILIAVNVAAAARERVERASGLSEQQIALNTAKVRADALTFVLKQYQDEYNAQIAIAQGYQAKINAIEQDRIAFNQGIQSKLFEIRLQSLSGLDVYVERVKKIDELIAQAQVAAEKGRTDLVKDFIAQIDAQSAKLGAVVRADGTVIISAFEAQQKQLAIMRRESDIYNTSLDKQDTLAKDGFDAAKKGADELLPKIKSVREELDAVNAILKDGLLVKVAIDETSITTVINTINELVKARTLTIMLNVQSARIDTNQQNLDLGTFEGAGQGLAGGGYIGPMRYAGGGPVFRPPTWSKVPGNGSGDTVPTALPLGSFVMRKAASSRYGDNVLARIARGYADGGTVEKNNFPENYWVTYKDTIAKLRALQEASIGAPRPFAPYIGLGDWAAKAIDEFVFFSKDHREEIKTLIDKVFEGWLQGIASARSLHVPLTMELGLSALLGRYAKGGAVGELPAWVEPGEWVIQPKAVDAVSRLFGGGFLPALNAMQIPADFFDGMRNFAPPQPYMPHFAEGGLVGFPSLAMRAADRTVASTGNTYHLHFGDVADPDNFVRRHVIPALDKINKRSR